MSQLTILKMLLRNCLEDHGSCLGKCEYTPLPFREVDIRLPESVVPYALGKHFHLSYDPDANRYYARDYDCIVNISSPSIEDAVQRYFVQRYILALRSREGVLYYK